MSTSLLLFLKSFSSQATTTSATLTSTSSSNNYNGYNNNNNNNDNDNTVASTLASSPSSASIHPPPHHHPPHNHQHHQQHHHRRPPLVPRPRRDTPFKKKKDAILPIRHSRNMLAPTCLDPEELYELTQELLQANPGTLFPYQDPTDFVADADGSNNYDNSMSQRITKSNGSNNSRNWEEEDHNSDNYNMFPYRTIEMDRDDAWNAADLTIQKAEYVIRGHAAQVPGTMWHRWWMVDEHDDNNDYLEGAAAESTESSINNNNNNIDDNAANTVTTTTLDSIQCIIAIIDRLQLEGNLYMNLRRERLEQLEREQFGEQDQNYYYNGDVDEYENDEYENDDDAAISDHFQVEEPQYEETSDGDGGSGGDYDIDDDDGGGGGGDYYNDGGDDDNDYSEWGEQGPLERRYEEIRDLAANALRDNEFDTAAATTTTTSDDPFFMLEYPMTQDEESDMANWIEELLATYANESDEEWIESVKRDLHATKWKMAYELIALDIMAKEARDELRAKKRRKRATPLDGELNIYGNDDNEEFVTELWVNSDDDDDEEKRDLSVADGKYDDDDDDEESDLSVTDDDDEESDFLVTDDEDEKDEGDEDEDDDLLVSDVDDDDEEESEGESESESESDSLVADDNVDDDDEKSDVFETDSDEDDNDEDEDDNDEDEDGDDVSDETEEDYVVSEEEHLQRLAWEYPFAAPGPTVAMLDTLLDCFAVAPPEYSHLIPPEVAAEAMTMILDRHMIDGGDEKNTNPHTVPTLVSYNAFLRIMANVPYDNNSNDDNEHEASLLRDQALYYSFGMYDALRHCSNLSRNSATMTYMLTIVSKFFPPSRTRGNVAHGLWMHTVRNGLVDANNLEAIRAAHSPANGPEFEEWKRKYLNGKKGVRDLPQKLYRNSQVRRYTPREPTY